MKFPIFLGAFLYIITTHHINGEVDFCFKFGPKHNVSNKEYRENVSALLVQVGQEIENQLKNAVKESPFGSTSGTYTNFHLNLSHPAITLQGDFTNGTTFIEDSSIKLWTFKEQGLEIFNLTFPYIFVNGSYNASGYVGAHDLFDIYGTGTFHLTMKNFSIAAVTGLFINSSALCIPLTVNVYLKDYKSYFLNFMNGDEELEPLVNGAIEALVPDAVRIIFRESMDKASPYIQADIDKILHDSALSRLLYILAVNEQELNT